jgi:hypothetical protein
MKITPREAEALREAAEVAEAQMELVETMKRRAMRAARPAGPARHPALMIGLGLALVLLSSMSLQIWP